MSRIGKMPVVVPDKVSVKLDGQDIQVEGPNGKLARTFGDIVDVKLEGGELIVSRRDDSRESRAHHGLVRALLANMVEGVSTGFVRELEINGVGYRAELKGRFIRFDLGYSHPIYFELPETVDAEVAATAIKLKSSSKELVGQVAAKIRGFRKPEPYKGKGVKYKEERIIRKAGKAGR